MPDNRRSATRHDVEIVATVAIDGGAAEPCQIKNLSLGGALIEFRRLAMGARTTMTLRIPTSEADLVIGGIVRWANQDGVGIQFDGLRARDVFALGKFFEGL